MKFDTLPPGMPQALLLSLWIASTGLARAQDENPLAYRPLPAPTGTTESTPMTRLLLAPLGWYSEFLSPVDSDRCPSHPNCSQYAREALTRHGAIPGLWLTVDRLIHERTEIHRPDRVLLPDGTPRVPDSLNSNDFWFHQPDQEHP
ncbi:MAG: membrane protein insertion efficiency factor YidD [Magnetococcales bacterium]|nr:membrane protein insertion efficiency factor YidD [Magnetococcales bacterium]